MGLSSVSIIIDIERRPRLASSNSAWHLPAGAGATTTSTRAASTLTDASSLTVRSGWPRGWRARRGSSARSPSRAAGARRRAAAPAPSPTSRSIKVSTSQREDGVVFRLGGVARGAVRRVRRPRPRHPCGATTAVGGLAAARLPSRRRRRGSSTHATGCEHRSKSAQERQASGDRLRLSDALGRARHAAVLRGVRPGFPRARRPREPRRVREGPRVVVRRRRRGGGAQRPPRAAKPGDDGLAGTSHRTRGDARFVLSSHSPSTKVRPFASDVSSPSR